MGTVGTANGYGAKAAWVASVLACAVTVVVLVGPGGDFPLSDDWSYAHTTKQLCEDGVLEFLPWTGASLVFQAAYGALVCKLTGFSFEALRYSTLALALVAVVCFGVLLGQLGVRGKAAALAMVLFGLNPLFVNLSFTFMTDLPFTALALGAGCLYVRGLHRQSSMVLMTAALLCAASLLVRQHGIFVAAAAALTALVVYKDRPWPARLKLAAASGALPAIVFVLFNLWLFGRHGAPAGLENKVAELGAASFLELANSAFRGIEYLGLLLFPLAVALAGTAGRRERSHATVAIFVLGATALFLYLREGALMPYLTNLIYDLGLGASSLRDTQFLGLPPPTQLGGAFALVLTLMATTGAAVLVSAAINSGGQLDRDPGRCFVALAALLLFAGSLLHAGFYFDRYLLPVLPFALAALLAPHAGLRLGSGAAALAALMAFYAVAGTHDYMAWNRARWHGLAKLEATGVTAREIDGGMEFNGWRLARELDRWPNKETARIGQAAELKSWWWVVDDRYVASFRPLDGYGVKYRIDYRRWLPPGSGAVFILEREKN